MMNEEIRSHYRTHGYAIVRGAYDPERVARLLAICNRVLEQWRRAPQTHNPPVGPQSTYMRHLNHPEYHRESPGGLAYLLDSIAEPRLIEAVEAALEDEFLFSATSLYFNPTGVSEDGFWHKDSIGEWPDPRDKETGIGVSVQIALVPSEDLELVPGSHVRDYTDAERHICVDDDRSHNRSHEMPNAARMVLSPGDAVLFNALTVHRGRYHADKLRRTFMVVYRKVRTAREELSQRGLNQYTDQPWFLLPGYLDGVRQETEACFHRYVEFYAESWRSRLSELNKYLWLAATLNQTGDPNPFFAVPTS